MRIVNCNGIIYYYNIRGVFQNDEIVRWRVENSWGKSTNTNGYIMMTTEWFKEYVFEVVVDKKLLPRYVLDVFHQKPIILPLWDQLGAYSLVKW